MGGSKKLNGRPKSTEETKSKFINVRFTESEFNGIIDIEKELGISKTDFIRMRVLDNAGAVVVNSRELLKYLDQIGAEMGRVGNNINQVARHANSLKLQGSLNASIIAEFDRLFNEYVKMQHLLEISLRKILRAMGK